MKSPLFSPVFHLIALAGVAAADVPKKASLSRYTTLYTNSPFTSKPPPVEEGPDNNPLDDYALIGVSSIGVAGAGSDKNDYRVTLINKKKPDEPRIIVDSNNPGASFKILGVTRKAGDPLGTVVRMSSGSMTGTVSYDEKLLTIAAPKPAPQNPGVPVQGQQGQLGAPPQAGQAPQLQADGQPVPQRVPRPRVVPPPANPQAGGQAAQQPATQQNNQQRQPRTQRRGN